MSQAAAAYVEDSCTVAEVGLLVLGGPVGVLPVAGGLATRRRGPLTPWRVLGALPAGVGGLLVL